MVFDLLFRVGPAIKAIFELGYEPKEELFYELTAEQYSQLEKKGNDMSKKWFTIIPEDPKLDVPELLIVDENGTKTFLDAANYIHRDFDGAVDFHAKTRILRILNSSFYPSIA